MLWLNMFQEFLYRQSTILYDGYAILQTTQQYSQLEKWTIFYQRATKDNNTYLAYFVYKKSQNLYINDSNVNLGS